MVEARSAVVAIAHDLDVARIEVHSGEAQGDAAAGILDALARHSVPVDLLACSGTCEDALRMGFTIRRSALEEIRLPLLRAAAAFGGTLRVNENVGKLSVVGMGLLNRAGYTSRVLSALSAAGIPTEWIGTSQLRISAILPLGQLIHGVDVLHREFELERDDLGVGSRTPA